MGIRTCCFLLCLMVVCTFGDTARGEQEKEIEVNSPVFTWGEAIPVKYTCDGDNVSPPLSWKGVPKGASSLALICDDPDAPGGTWVHWVLYNLPPEERGLPEGVPSKEVLENRARQGRNDFRKIGYGGPCPPGGTHRYFFKVYALDAEAGLEPGATKAQLLEAMKGHVIGKGRLMGEYKR